MKDLQPIRGRNYISGLVQQGEHQRLDFKYTVPDARKIARSISAFANNEGGMLLIGVKDNGTIAGVRNDEDIFLVEQAARRYCIPSQTVRFDAFTTDPGVVVIRVTVEQAQQRPVYVDEGAGRGHVAYYRVADENIVAHPLMVRAWAIGQSGISFDSRTADVLRAIAMTGEIDPRSLALKLHMSFQTTDEIVASMLSAGLIGFRLTGTSFVLSV